MFCSWKTHPYPNKEGICLIHTPTLKWILENLSTWNWLHSLIIEILCLLHTNQQAKLILASVKSKANTGLWRLAVSGSPWHLILLLGNYKNVTFSIEVICWAPRILQVQSTGLPSIFLTAQTWNKYLLVIGQCLTQVCPTPLMQTVHVCKVRHKKCSKTEDLNNTVESRLSGLVGTWVNSLDNRESG